MTADEFDELLAVLMFSSDQRERIEAGRKLRRLVQRGEMGDATPVASA